MLSGLFTKEGILLGSLEYGAYSSIARLIMIAFVTDLAIRFLYVHRFGIYLVANLSSKAGFRILRANFMHPANKQWASRLQVIGLFAMAVLVTRGLDVIASIYSSAMQARWSKRMVIVRTLDTSPNARPAVRSASILRPLNRSDVYHALHSIVKGSDAVVDVQQPVWPNTIGSLSDVEVAALVLPQDGSICTATDLGPVPTPLRPGTVNATTATLSSIEPLRMRSMSLFGENVELFTFKFDATSPSNGIDRWLALPVPISYPIGQGGQQAIMAQARRQFGVLSGRTSDLVAYDMECGWTPEKVDAWLQEKQKSRPSLSSLNPRNGSTLWYADMMRTDMSDGDETRGWTAAVIMDVTKEAYNAGELELLSFGSPIQGWAYYYGMSVVPLSNLIRMSEADASKIFPYSTIADALPSQPAKQTGCSPVDVAFAVYRPKNNNPLSDEDAGVRWVSRGPTKKFSTSNEQPIRRCSIDFGPHPTNRSARIMDYYHDPANRGAQICRTKLRSFSCDMGDDLLSSRDGFVDLVVATQFSTTSEQNTEVRCLSHDVGRPLAPVSLPLASSRNGRWGVIADNALQAFNKSTPEDQAGAQAWFMDVLVVPWLELGIVLAATAYLLTISGWDDLAEVVAMVMYSFTYRPLPPALSRGSTLMDASSTTLPVSAERADHEPMHLQHGVVGINLLQPIVFAAVEYDDPLASKLKDGSPAMEVRLIPHAWNVQPGDNLSLSVRSEGEGQGRVLEETVYQVSDQIGQLVNGVKRSKRKHHPL